MPLRYGLFSKVSGTGDSSQRLLKRETQSNHRLVILLPPAGLFYSPYALSQTPAARQEIPPILHESPVRLAR